MSTILRMRGLVVSSLRVPLRNTSSSRILPRTQSLQYTSQFSSCAPHRAQFQRFNANVPNPKRTRRNQIVVAVAALCGVYYVAHLEQLEETGRWRFMDVSPQQEARLAEAAREQGLEEYKDKILPQNHVLTRHVSRVVTRLLETNNLGTLRTENPVEKPQPPPMSLGSAVWDPDTDMQSGSLDVADASPKREWTLMVLNDDSTQNAAATFGVILVFTGILPVAKNEEGLAAILSHEMGHVVARHMSERVSYAKVLIAFQTLLASLGLDLGLSSIVSTLLLTLPNTRKQEYEADKIGLKILANACYDPRSAPEMFRRLDELEKRRGGHVPTLLSTHPSSEDRMKRLESLLPAAYDLQAASPVCAGMQDQMNQFQDTFGLQRLRQRVPWGV